jgi:voltage-dependent calcium channel L type alpha-1D
MYKCPRLCIPLGLKVLVNGVFASLPPLFNAGILLSFSYLTFAILGMEIWRDKYHGRCRATPFPVKIPWRDIAPNASTEAEFARAMYIWSPIVIADPERYRCVPPPYVAADGDIDVWTSPQECFWPVDTHDTIGFYCGASGGRECRVGTTCGSNYDEEGNPRFLNVMNGSRIVFNVMREAEFLPNLNFGFTSFDNLPSTMVIAMQIVTASNWMALTVNVISAVMIKDHIYIYA